jgi:hypothetical protein
MILISLSYLHKAELAINPYPFLAFQIMIHCILRTKILTTGIWTLVLYSYAFFIQMINEVFDFNWNEGFIAPFSSTAQNIQVFIDFVCYFWWITIISIIIICPAFVAVIEILMTASTKDLLTFWSCALYRFTCQFVECHAFKEVKKWSKLLVISDLVNFSSEFKSWEAIFGNKFIFVLLVKLRIYD